MWSQATEREKTGLLMVVWFGAITVLSMTYRSGLELLTKGAWLLGFVVLAWALYGSIMHRIVQDSLTSAYIEKVREELTGEPLTTFVYADEEHVYTPETGWGTRSAD